MTNLMSSPFVMIMLMDAISVLRRLLRRFCSVDSIGLPFSKTCMLIAHLVSIAEVREYVEAKYDAPQAHFDC
jgi:hypothetical protein